LDVQRGHLFCMTPPRESRCSAQAGSSTPLATGPIEVFVVKRRQRIRPIFAVTRRAINRCGTADFPQRRYIARNHGCAASHCFDEGQSEAFAI
jgi:hypothetical protein